MNGDVAMERLTPRQRDVLLLACRDGLSRAEIADRLFVSPHTVRHHFVAVMVALFGDNGHRRYRTQQACYLLGLEGGQVAGAFG